jgi:hypothetical protein
VPSSGIDSPGSVSSPRIASGTTFAVNSALYGFLVVFIPVNSSGRE